MFTFGPEADARVQEDEPWMNEGYSERLRVDGGADPRVESYLRFDVTGLPGRVGNATLRLHADSDTSDGPAVYTSGPDWLEDEITWANRPARTSDAIDDAGELRAGDWVAYDVTSIVERDGVYSFVISTPSTDGADFHSREGRAPPQLVVSVDGAGGPYSTTPRETSTLEPSPMPVPDPVLLAAGDIASCDTQFDEATSGLVGGISGTVATLGDNVYPAGAESQFQECYEPSWGVHKDRTRPSVGNHEYVTEDAAGYFGYFGGAAGDPDEGYYSYDLGNWHIIVLNSNCHRVGGCAEGSPQEAWLRADLEAHKTSCTLAYWHHPRFSSGAQHGNSDFMRPAWEALYEYGAEVVLSAHEHSYERFAPQTPDGTPDVGGGIREFVVGTGGRSLYEFRSMPIATSEVRNNDTYGVLKLTLRPSSYDWEFVPIEGGTFTDSGASPCH